MKIPTTHLVRLAVAILFFSCVFVAYAPPQSDLGAGGVAPSFRLATLDGGQLGPEDLQGQVVLIDFWATWCGPCHAQAEILESIYAEYKARGLEILSIDVEETEEDVRRFVEDNPFPYPVLLDEEGKVSNQFAVLGLPTLVLIDKEGKIALTHTGVIGAAELKRHIEDALG